MKKRTKTYIPHGEVARRTWGKSLHYFLGAKLRNLVPVLCLVCWRHDFKYLYRIQNVQNIATLITVFLAICLWQLFHTKIIL